MIKPGRPFFSFVLLFLSVSKGATVLPIILIFWRARAGEQLSVRNRTTRLAIKRAASVVDQVWRCTGKLGAGKDFRMKLHIQEFRKILYLHCVNCLHRMLQKWCTDWCSFAPACLLVWCLLQLFSWAPWMFQAKNKLVCCKSRPSMTCLQSLWISWSFCKPQTRRHPIK